jgi:hypothetical protein
VEAASREVTLHGFEAASQEVMLHGFEVASRELSQEALKSWLTLLCCWRDGRVFRSCGAPAHRHHLPL